LTSSLVNTPLPLMHLIATNFVESLKDVLTSKVNGQLVEQFGRQVNGQFGGQVGGQFGGQLVGQLVGQFPDFDQIEDETRAHYQEQPN
jgi:hypothetical protein